ncbi:hypothetical protein ANN_03078 [Periplaneta americana]|uniref:Reverse transcriptase domain-containing protein n=1 Tax=Periplaneta americana TaxID=6978 RepID=A0ABQ8U1V5_PERAM|nr:hypothetical protein ANN_03078 [Periplaneta americana]
MRREREDKRREDMKGKRNERKERGGRKERRRQEFNQTYYNESVAVPNDYLWNTLTPAASLDPLENVVGCCYLLCRTLRQIMEVIDALDSTDSSAVAAVKSLPSEQLLEDILFIDSNFKIVSKTITLLESSKLQTSKALNKTDKASQIVPPKSWGNAIIISIFKKNNRQDCDNYSGISLLNSGYKIYANIIKSKLSKFYDSLIGEEQMGFRKGRSCAGEYFTVKLLLEKHKEFNIETHMAFVDFKKAFDKIDRSRLIQILVGDNVPQQFIHNIHNIYNQNKIAIKQDGKLSSWTPINTGVRQGCGLSPILFIIYMNRIIKEWKQTHHGYIQINRHLKLDSILFADDLVLLALSEDDLQRNDEEYGKRLSGRPFPLFLVTKKKDGMKASNYPRRMMQNKRTVRLTDFENKLLASDDQHSVLCDLPTSGAGKMVTSIIDGSNRANSRLTDSRGGLRRGLCFIEEVGTSAGSPSQEGVREGRSGKRSGRVGGDETIFKQRTSQSISEISKEDWIKCCQLVKHIEDEYWRRDALIEEKVERIVINIGIVSSDKDEMDYDRPGSSTDTADEDSSTDSADEIETSASGAQLLLE